MVLASLLTMAHPRKPRKATSSRTEMAEPPMARLIQPPILAGAVKVEEERNWKRW